MKPFKKLRKLLEAATPGPWEAHFVFGSSDLPIAVIVDNGKSDTIVMVHKDDCSEKPSDDIRFIAEAHNQLPAVLEVLDAAIETLEYVARGNSNIWSYQARETLAKIKALANE